MCTIRVEIVYCGTCETDACGVTDGTQRRTTRADACDSRDVETAHARAKRQARSVDASDRRVVAGRKKFSRRARA